jgi:hypothetical protein
VSRIESRFADAGALPALHDYFARKTAGDLDALVACFAPTASYNDATLGWHIAGREAIAAGFGRFVPRWVEAGAESRPTRYLGGLLGGVAAVSASPELLGSDLRALTVIDRRDGRIVRLVDYWDGRHFGRNAAAALRTGDADFPETFGEPLAGSTPFDDDAERIAAALARGDADALAALSCEDVAVEDLTLGVRRHGRPAVAVALGRALEALPWGGGITVRHVTGGSCGGAVEWTNPRSPVPRGVLAVGLDDRGRLAELTALWDGSLVGDDQLAVWVRMLLDL